MSVSNELNQWSYNGDGSTKTFSVGYFLRDSDLKVQLVKSNGFVELLELGVHYSVSGAKVITGGTVTLATAPASGERLVITRDVEYTQRFVFEENAVIQAKEIERALDNTVMMVQQLKSREDKYISAPESDANTVNLQLPAANERAGKLLFFHSDGSVGCGSIAGLTTQIQTFGNGLAVTGNLLYCSGELNSDLKLKGDKLVYRLKDTQGGSEWGLRNNSGSLEIVKNTGSESSPIWTVANSISSTAGILDGRVAVSTEDTNRSYLENKIGAGDGIIFNKVNPNGNEVIVISTDGKCFVNTSDPTRQYLSDAIIAGDNVVINVVNGASNKQIKISAKIKKLPIYIHKAMTEVTSTTYKDAGSFTIYVPPGYSNLQMKLYVYIKEQPFSGGTARCWFRSRTADNVYSTEYVLEGNSNYGNYYGYGTIYQSGLTPDADNTITFQIKGELNQYIRFVTTGGGQIDNTSTCWLY